MIIRLNRPGSQQILYWFVFSIRIGEANVGLRGSYLHLDPPSISVEPHDKYLVGNATRHIPKEDRFSHEHRSPFLLCF